MPKGLEKEGGSWKSFSPKEETTITRQNNMDRTGKMIEIPLFLIRCFGFEFLGKKNISLGVSSILEMDPTMCKFGFSQTSILIPIVGKHKNKTLYTHSVSF